MVLLRLLIMRPLYSILIASFLMLSACGSKTPPSQTTLSDDSNMEEVEQPTPKPSSSDNEQYSEDLSEPLGGDEAICTAIKNYILGKSGAAILSDRAKADLSESSWPEVQCSVEGELDSPRSFKNLTVRQVAPGKYKYECTCPDHGDKFVDFCTMEAHIANDGKTVVIERIKWDTIGSQSVSTLIDNATWYSTDYGFKMPNFMTPSTDIFVEDVPASFQRWTYDDICVACWPDLGSWAVTDYPTPSQYLTEDVLINNVTYQSGSNTIFSGYTNDGRIWYMKKKISSGRAVDNVKSLVLIYPKSKQTDIKRLIDVVKGW